MPEIVYVLTNEAMPGLVKIGRTNDSVESRVAQLSSWTGVPLPFEIHYAAEVDDGARVEKLLHHLFADHRVNPKREFFKIDAEKAVIALGIGQFKEISTGPLQVDPAEQQALDTIKARRSRLRLDAIGVKPGEQLVFSRDESVTATVAPDGRAVVLDGEQLSLSAAAQKVLGRRGSYKALPSVSGALYWMYGGELLDERRRRLESEQFENSEIEIEAHLHGGGVISIAPNLEVPPDGD